MNPLVVRFGYADGVPDGVGAAWAGRLLVGRAGGRIVVTPDRVGYARGGDEVERLELERHLRRVVGTAVVDSLRGMLARGEVRVGVPCLVYDDGVVRFVGIAYDAARFDVVGFLIPAGDG